MKILLALQESKASRNKLVRTNGALTMIPCRIPIYQSDSLDTGPQMNTWLFYLLYNT